MINTEILKAHYFSYAERADLPYVIYKRGLGAPGDLPRFVWVYPDGAWEARDGKYTRDVVSGRPILPVASGLLNPR